MFGAKRGTIVNKEMTEEQKAKMAAKEAKRREDYMNSMVTRREVAAIIDAYMMETNRQLEELSKGVNIQNYLVEGMKEMLIAKGIFTEEQLLAEMERIIKDVRARMEEEAKEKAVAMKADADAKFEAKKAAEKSTEQQA